MFQLPTPLLSWPFPFPPGCSLGPYCNLPPSIRPPPPAHAFSTVLRHPVRLRPTLASRMLVSTRATPWFSLNSWILLTLLNSDSTVVRLVFRSMTWLMPWRGPTSSVVAACFSSCRRGRCQPERAAQEQGGSPCPSFPCSQGLFSSLPACHPGHKLDTRALPQRWLVDGARQATLLWCVAKTCCQRPRKWEASCPEGNASPAVQWEQRDTGPSPSGTSDSPATAGCSLSHPLPPGNL